MDLQKYHYNFLKSVPLCGYVLNIPESLIFTFTPSKICIAQFGRCRASESTNKCWLQSAMLHFNSTVKPVITSKVEVNNNLNTYRMKVETLYRGRRNAPERPKIFDFNRFKAIRFALTKFHLFCTWSNLAVVINYFLPGINHYIAYI